MLEEECDVSLSPGCAWPIDWGHGERMGVLKAQDRPEGEMQPWNWDQREAWLSLHQSQAFLIFAPARRRRRMLRWSGITKLIWKRSIGWFWNNVSWISYHGTKMQGAKEKERRRRAIYLQNAGILRSKSEGKQTCCLLAYSWEPSWSVENNTCWLEQNGLSNTSMNLKRDASTEGPGIVLELLYMINLVKISSIFSLRWEFLLSRPTWNWLYQ